MAKYNFEFKKKIVQSYISGEGSYKYLAKKYKVTNDCMIQRWVKAYQVFGNYGLVRSRKNEKYPFEFKLHVVELYLTSELSYQELALQVGINNPPLISKWINDYRVAGPDALRDKIKGRRPKVEKPKNDEITTSIPKNTCTEYLKQLEQENLKLRIENAYLKELRRLRLEEEALLKKQRESSTASEETSN